QDGAELQPHAGVLPIAQAAPAGHAAAAAHLLGQVFPLDTGLENEENARERLAVVHRLSARGVAPAAVRRRQKGSNNFPQVIGEQWLGHDSISWVADEDPTR